MTLKSEGPSHIKSRTFINGTKVKGTVDSLTFT